MLAQFPEETGGAAGVEFAGLEEEEDWGTVAVNGGCGCEALVAVVEVVGMLFWFCIGTVEDELSIELLFWVVVVELELNGFIESLFHPEELSFNGL